MSRTKILIVNPTSSIGGAEVNILKLIDHKINKDISYFFLNLQFGATGTFCKQIQKRGQPYTERSKPTNIFSLFSTMFFIYKYIRRNRIDIIYFYGLRSLATGLLPGLAAKTKIVYALRGDLDSFRGSRIFFIEKYFNYFVDYWIANSKYALRMAYARIGAKRSRSWLVYNGVEVKSSIGAKVKDARKLKIIVVANIHIYKGHLSLLQALSFLNDKQRKNIEVLFIGENYLGDELNNSIKRLGLTEIVQYGGYSKNVDSYLKESDLFILPSETESFPTSILEAMTAGLPIISTDVGGVSELVINNKAGLLVQPLNPNELATAITYFMRNDGVINWEKINEMGKYARHYVIKNHSINTMVESTERVFKSIVSSKHHPQ